MMRGIIVTEHFPQCGVCENTFPDYKGCTKSQLLHTMKCDGWRYTKKYGWVCPECMETADLNGNGA